MSAPSLGDVQTWEELNDLIASLQVWVGKTEGVGRWGDYVAQASEFSAFGNGNSWVVPGLSKTVGIAYALVGDTMHLSIYVPTSTITIATAATVVQVRVPGGYKASGGQSSSSGAGRLYTGHGSVINGASFVPARVFITGGSQFVNVEISTGVYATGTLYVEGAITFRVEPA